MNFIETLTPEDTLTFLTIEKPFIDLCTKQNASQNRLAAVERNCKRCSDENDNIDDEIKNTREVSFKAKEKLNRISSLCSDLRYIHVFLCMYAFIPIKLCIEPYMYIVYANMRIYTYAYICIHTYIYMNMYIYAHIYI
jgi:hypothetical protein